MQTFKAVVFDWAGTLVDFGSVAPVHAFVRAFEAFGVEVTVDEARRPMGASKRDHIAEMFGDAGVAGRWRETHGAPPGDADIERVYSVFVPLNEHVAAEHATLVPGALATIRRLRARGLKIGSTTGYTRSIMARLLPVAAAQGFVPDNVVCADDLAEGRPAPLGMYRCFVDLAVYPPSRVIKVDDTAPGIAEGTAAGCPTVGVLLSGNGCGLSPQALAALDEDSVQAIRDRVGATLRAAGADYLIDTVADLPALIERLETGTGPDA